LGSGWTRKELAEKAEVARAAKAELETAESASSMYLAKIEQLDRRLFEPGVNRSMTSRPPWVRMLSLRQNSPHEWSDLRQAAVDRLKGENEALINTEGELGSREAKGEAVITVPVGIHSEKRRIS